MSERVSEGGTWGRYRLGERLGVGGMAEVFRAVAPGAAGFEKPCVIKRILPEYAGDKNFVGMFVNEARIGASLAHPNIVQIYDFGEIDGEYFMSMEFIHGTDLARLLWRLLQRKRTVPAPLVAFIAVDVLRALEFAHNRVGADGRPSPVIHRDVSPQNILVSMDGLVKLADFGLARAMDHARLTRPGTLKGKLSYMSPEQAFGKEMDPRTDLFSLGIVMYELLVGKSLFRAKTDAETLARVRAAAVPEFEKVVDVHPALAGAIRKALAREATDRFGSAAEFRRVLLDYLRGVTPPVEASTLGSLVREAVSLAQKPPESTAEATEMADADALEIAAAQTAMLGSGRRSDGDSDAPPDGPWVEGPGAAALTGAIAVPAPAAPAKPAPAPERPKTPPRQMPAQKITVPQRGGAVVQVEQVVVVGRGSMPPLAPSDPKVEVADQATLLAPPKGEAIPVTPPHGTRLPARETQMFGSVQAPPEGSGETRDSEDKVTVMLPGPASLPHGIVPEVPPTDPHGHAAYRGGGPDQPLFTQSVKEMQWPTPSIRDQETEQISSRPSSGPSILGLVIIGFGLLIVSAVVTWAIVSL